MRKIISAALLSLLCFASQGAAAQACSASSNPVAFGNYDPFSSTVTDSIGSVTVTCQSTISLLVLYTIKLDGGSAGSITGRRMVSGGWNLFYQIYNSAARSTVWGDGTAGSVFTTDGYLLSVVTPYVKTYNVWGRITAKQNIGTGNYLDTVTILLNY